MVILISSIIVLFQIDSSSAATTRRASHKSTKLHTEGVSTATKSPYCKTKPCTISSSKGVGPSSTSEQSSKGGVNIVGTVKTRADPVAIKLTNKGNDKLELGYATEAMEYYNEALDMEPRNKVALTGKGIAFKKLNNYEKAMEYYDKALAIDPNYDSALYDKAILLSILGRCKAAIEYYDRALDENPNHTGALKGKKITLQKINNNTCSSTYSSTTHRIIRTTTLPVTTPTITPTITKNNPPLAQDKSVTTNMSTPIDIILPASDPDLNDKVTATITAAPLNGRLSDVNQENSKVTYTPRAGFTSSDSFMFKVNDGKADSNTAVVTLAINPEQQQQIPTTTTPPSSLPPPPTTTLTTSSSIADELTKLVNLRNQGIISEQEFGQLKNNLIKSGGIGGGVSTVGNTGVIDGSMVGTTTMRTGENTTDDGTTASDGVSRVDTSNCNGTPTLTTTDRAKSDSGNGNTTAKAMNDCNASTDGTTTGGNTTDDGIGGSTDDNGGTDISTTTTGSNQTSPPTTPTPSPPTPSPTTPTPSPPTPSPTTPTPSPPTPSPTTPTPSPPTPSPTTPTPLPPPPPSPSSPSCRIAKAFSPENTDNPICEIEVNASPTEVNPLSASAQSTITVTARTRDHQPAAGEKIEIRACTKNGGPPSSISGDPDADGHTHPDPGTGDPSCPEGFRSSRPHSTLGWFCCDASFPQQSGNPITVVTDKDGIAKIQYIPPSYIKGKDKTYYISGQDKIVATSSSDPSIKKDNQMISTKVPGLKAMFGSSLEDVPANKECFKGGTFILASQQKHKCLFYGTPSTNEALLKIANDYMQRQIDCRNKPGSHFCEVTQDGPVRDVTKDSKVPKQMVQINELDTNLIPIRITAMSLPWGGLLDIEGDWQTGHLSHSDGKKVDIGFANLPDYEHKLLLRQVILDDDQFTINPCEGGINIVVERQVCVDKKFKAQADHIHLNLKK